ncbi:MAG: hypothetical protein ACOC8N_03250 [Spirochaetota bacterium]
MRPTRFRPIPPVLLALAALWGGLLAGPRVLGGAEVSERQDLAVFGVTAGAHSLPESVLQYIDSSINQVFVGLRRFNVLGYGEYRLGEGNIGEFVQRIREIRAQAAREAGEYDEKFGALVIRGEDFDRIVNSFIVVVPVLSDYRADRERSSVFRDGALYLYTTYRVELTIDLSFVHVREGEQKYSLRLQGSGSGSDLSRARKDAVDGAVGALSGRLRQLEEFRIRSGVVEVRGDTVLFEPGSDMGIKPGDEYRVMTRVEVGGTGRVTTMPTGLVRVKRTYPELSEARVVARGEPITEGDQLVEVAGSGIELSFRGGVAQVRIPDMDYDLLLEGDGSGQEAAMSLGQKSREAAAFAAVSVHKSLGYRYRGVFDATALLNFPLFAGIGELGVGAAFHQRRLTLELAAQGGVLYMTSFRRDLRDTGGTGSITIDGTTIRFDNDPVMNVYGFGAGLRGSANLSVLINPGLSLSAGAGYRLYTPIKRWFITVQETAGGDLDTVTIRSDDDNLDSTGGGMKSVDISGLELGLALTARF